MKRVLTLALAALVLASPASAQEDVERSDWSFNTRVWSTNYWTYLLTNVASMAVKGILYVGDTERMDMVDRFVPTADLVFPIGMQKDGFGDNNIYGPYHRAWSTPFKRMGDFAAGGDVSWSPWFVGLYAGCYFKSQEICFQDPQKYLRGYYVQPRAGISLLRINVCALRLWICSRTALAWTSPSAIPVAVAIASSCCSSQCPCTVSSTRISWHPTARRSTTA